MILLRFTHSMLWHDLPLSYAHPASQFWSSTALVRSWLVTPVSVINGLRPTCHCLALARIMIDGCRSTLSFEIWIVIHMMINSITANLPDLATLTYRPTVAMRHWSALVTRHWRQLSEAGYGIWTHPKIDFKVIPFPGIMRCTCRIGKVKHHIMCIT